MKQGKRFVVEDVSLLSLPLPSERMKWWHLLVEPLSPTEFCSMVKEANGVFVSRKTASFISRLCGINVQSTGFHPPSISENDELVVLQLLEIPDKRLPLAALAEMIKEGKARFYRITFSEYFY